MPPLRSSRSFGPGASPVRRGLRRVLVARQAGQRSRGKLVLPSGVIPCALGRNGITHRKREGDGATPAGRLPVGALWMRSDRLPGARTAFRRIAIRPDDGWCDDPATALYNRPIPLPAAVSHEVLWRDDSLYDLVLTLDYNLRHPLRGRGSAIFLHVARDDGAATAGCVAIRRDDLRRLLPRLARGAVLLVTD